MPQERSERRPGCDERTDVHADEKCGDAHRVPRRWLEREVGGEIVDRVGAERSNPGRARALERFLGLGAAPQ